ncbi:uncharacterized protein [Elaeis guineensis]|uniref:uncharacterized protein n=1 Tax=Elaeis guineensis var. tenera TaxID=51953 RepID=UPI003C6D2ADD
MPGIPPETMTHRLNIDSSMRPSAKRCSRSSKSCDKPSGSPGRTSAGKPSRKLKRYLASPPLLVRSEVGEVLYFYLATSPEAVSSVLIRENENRVHQSIYYVSKVLHEAETQYSKVEKIIFALVISAQRLRPYFQAHAIVVLTDQPLRAILHRPEHQDGLAKWTVRLRSSTSNTGNDLPSKLRFWPTSSRMPDDRPTVGEGSPVEVGTSDCDPNSAWVLHIDGASNAQGSGGRFPAHQLRGGGY